MKLKQKITTFLWYDGQAEEAANLYTSIFKDSKILATIPGPGAKPMGVTFQLAGQEFIALNGGPLYKFTEAVSLYVNCESQAEIDDLWSKLIAGGGSPNRCGWLKDKFGLSWQIIPSILSDMFADKDSEKAGRAMQAMLTMVKLDIAKLKAAYEGR